MRRTGEMQRKPGGEGSGVGGVFGAPKAKPGSPSVCTGSQDMEMISSKGCWLQPQVYQVKGGA